jgi:hypothetical protein
VSDDDEHKQNAETERGNSKEIQRNKIAGVIGQKGAPALRGLFARGRELARDGPLGNLNTQLEQLAVDGPWLSGSEAPG